MGLLDCFKDKNYSPELAPVETMPHHSICDEVDQMTILYTQKDEKSLLYKGIKAATNLSDKTVSHLGHRACKIFAVWVELKSKGFISLSFIDYFTYLMDHSFVSLETCALKVTQQEVLNAMSIDRTLNCPVKIVEIDNLYNFQSYDKATNWTGTIRIEPSKDNFHSISTYNLNGAIKISDISSRGTRVSPWKFVTPDNFKYFTSIQRG